MTLQRGEVVLIPFPFTDHSAHKRRPVMVLTDPDEYEDFLGVAITSQPGHADAIALFDTYFERGKLPKPSWHLSARVYTLNRDNIVGLFGQLKPKAMARLQGEVCRQPGCRA